LKCVVLLRFKSELNKFT